MQRWHINEVLRLHVTCGYTIYSAAAVCVPATFSSHLGQQVCCDSIVDAATAEFHCPSTAVRYARRSDVPSSLLARKVPSTATGTEALLPRTFPL